MKIYILILVEIKHNKNSWILYHKYADMDVMNKNKCTVLSFMTVHLCVQFSSEVNECYYIAKNNVISGLFVCIVP